MTNPLFEDTSKPDRFVWSLRRIIKIAETKKVINRKNQVLAMKKQAELALYIIDHADQPK